MAWACIEIPANLRTLTSTASACANPVCPSWIIGVVIWIWWRSWCGWTTARWRNPSCARRTRCKGCICTMRWVVSPFLCNHNRAAIGVYKRRAGSGLKEGCVDIQERRSIHRCSGLVGANQIAVDGINQNIGFAQINMHDPKRAVGAEDCFEDLAGKLDAHVT